jgi:hypothetical protein
MSDAAETTPSDAPADPRRRRLANGFIFAFLAFQIAMPLRYYLGDRGYDERFSWRMFSTLRLQQCQMRVSERKGTPPADAARDVKVQADVQVAWVSLLERVRMPVVEKYLARRCEKQDADEVSYTRSCTNTDGSALPPQTLVMDCAKRELREAPR